MFVCLSGCVSNVRNYFAQTTFSIENAFLLIPWNAKLSAVIPVRPFFKTWKMIFWLIMTRYKNKWKKPHGHLIVIERLRLNQYIWKMQLSFCNDFFSVHLLFFSFTITFLLRFWLVHSILNQSFWKFYSIFPFFGWFCACTMDSDVFDSHDFFWFLRNFHI